MRSSKASLAYKAKRVRIANYLNRIAQKCKCAVSCDQAYNLMMTGNEKDTETALNVLKAMTKVVGGKTFVTEEGIAYTFLY